MVINTELVIPDFMVTSCYDNDGNYLFGFGSMWDESLLMWKTGECFEERIIKRISDVKMKVMVFYADGNYHHSKVYEWDDENMIWRDITEYAKVQGFKFDNSGFLGE